MATPDFSTFTSRLHFRGNLLFTSAMRIGAEKSQAVDAPDTPVLRDATGMPYIPGSSFKGALRSYVEAVARTLQAQAGLSDRNLACLAVGKSSKRLPEPDPVCLCQDEVTLLKNTSPNVWHTAGKLPPILAQRLPAAPAIQALVQAQGDAAAVDWVLRDLSCWTCRLFGAQWLASKVLIKDLYIDETTFLRTEIRDGVGIERDAGRAADGIKYRFEAVPVGTAFRLELLAENATEAELGLLWLGLQAFIRGEILLGGGKSRGLGWCRLIPDWDNSHYTDASNLLELLLPEVPSVTQTTLANRPATWLAAFAQAIGAVQEGNHA